VRPKDFAKLMKRLAHLSATATTKSAKQGMKSLFSR